jgi:hypothetical protein
MSIPRITELLESINTKLCGDVTVSVSIVDDGLVDLSTEVVDVIIDAWVYDDSERIRAFLAASGAITPISLSSNTAITDSDGKLCLYWSTDHVVIKNRLGSSKIIKYKYE